MFMNETLVLHLTLNFLNQLNKPVKGISVWITTNSLYSNLLSFLVFFYTLLAHIITVTQNWQNKHWFFMLLFFLKLVGVWFFFPLDDKSSV